MKTEENKSIANKKRSESMRKAWRAGAGTLGVRKRRKPLPCKCGCGKLAGLDRLYAQGCYNPGAGNRGKRHDAKWRMKQSEGVRRAYAQGKMQHAINQTTDFIEKRICKLRGRKRSEAAIKATSKAVKRAWAQGKYHTQAVINNRKVNLSRVGATPERMDVIREMRNMEKLRPIFSDAMKKQTEKWKKSGALEEIRRKAGNAVGMPDHLAAKAWIIRDPYGNTFQFSNLMEWARQNQHRFHDDRPESRAPFWKRIAGGISDLLNKKGRSCSYRGWTAVSKLELAAGGRDLLGRDYFLQKHE